MPLVGLDRAVGVPGEQLVPADAALDPLTRREDALQIDRAERGRLARVVDHDLAEVVARAQAVRGEDPHVDEVREVRELVQRLQALDGVRRQRLAVSPGDVQQRLRPDRPLEVDVQLDLRRGGGGAHGPRLRGRRRWPRRRDYRTTEATSRPPQVGSGWTLAPGPSRTWTESPVDETPGLRVAIPGRGATAETEAVPAVGGECRSEVELAVLGAVDEGVPFLRR